MLTMSCWLALAAAVSENGAIEGVVINAASRQPVAGAEVVLRVAIDGEPLPVSAEKADHQGRFQFTGLPVTAQYIYLPGANCDGVHYPGPKLRLTGERPRAEVQLEVCDAVAEPCPLVARSHEVLLEPGPRSLTVTETMLIENPTCTCYVGRTAGEGGEPATLELSIPSNFDRVTFFEEFYGRRFKVLDGKLVTSIPWTPGERELKWKYVLPRLSRSPAWHRLLDLPTTVLKVTVKTDKPDEVTSNLPRRSSTISGEVVFESRGDVLPVGHALDVQLAKGPVPWRAYGPWLALATLAGLIAAGIATVMRRPHRKSPNGRGKAGGTISSRRPPPRRVDGQPKSRRRKAA